VGISHLLRAADSLLAVLNLRGFQNLKRTEPVGVFDVRDMLNRGAGTCLQKFVFQTEKDDRSCTARD
jgi:hypothetical protein